MAALTKDRNTKRKADNDLVNFPVKAATTIYAGSLVVNDAGNAAPGRTAVGLRALGRADKYVANPGAAGAERVPIRRGTFCFANSSAGDLIALSDVGANCYIVDDQTVAKTDGGTTRSIAGVIRDVDASGVWVEI
jgi:hypothetical protein